ncbi:PKD domain-containing protein [Bacteroidota bacterium]
MKKLFSPALSLLLFLFISSWISCNKTDTPTLPDEEQEAYDHVLHLQNEVDSQLDSWFSSMDSLDAIKMAQQEFANDPAVSAAIISDQGISVQYTNGMRGGLFLNPRDGRSFGDSTKASMNNSQIDSNNGLKSLVNKNDYRILNPHYYERSEFTDYIATNNSISIQRINYPTALISKDAQCKLDQYADLAKYGIIHFYSHGYAWPKEDSITDVYMMSGETESNSTSAKYREDLDNGNILLIRSNGHNTYFISKNFIENHNDFSKDTVLFYGGFCYSFLGDWPDIVNSCAQGAYLGFDWSVNTWNNIEWSENLIDKLSDTTFNRPMEIADWMSDTDLEKFFWHDIDEKTVHVLYSGDPSLRLWDKKVELIPLSEDGAPILVSGLPNVAYPFKCKVISNITNLEYVWDIGDGSEPYKTTDNEVEVSWTQSGEFELSVTVNNKSTGDYIGKESLTAVIGSITPTWNSVEFKLNYFDAIIKEVAQPGNIITYHNDWGVDWTSDDFWHTGRYQNGTFTASWDVDNRIIGWSMTGYMELTFNEQLNTISGGTIHANLNNLNHPENHEFIDITLGEINANVWEKEQGEFRLYGKEGCNPNIIRNIYHEKYSKQGDVVSWTYSLESYSCDGNSQFYIRFKTE